MKYILGTILILIGLILWLIIMIPSFILRVLWELNPKNYNFDFEYNHFTRKYFPFVIFSIYADDKYDYDSYFHYLFNIKQSIKW